MKKIILGVLISAATMGSAFAACPYNLDATASQISSLPSFPASTIFPSIVGQKSTYTISSNQSDPYNIKQYGAGGTGFVQNIINNIPVGDKNLGTSGEYVFEFLVNNFMSTGVSDDAYVSIGYQFLVSDTSTPIKIGAVSLVNDNNYGTYVGVNLNNPDGTGIVVQRYPVSLPIGSNFRVGLFINQTSKQIGLNVNGVNKGYISSYSGTPTKIGIMTLGNTARVKSTHGYIGQQISGELITDSTQMGLSYSSGAKDICGNTI